MIECIFFLSPDNCPEEFACFNSLYAHLANKHPGTFRCPYCSQTICLNEHMITEHLSSVHRGFDEFQCLKCDDGFNNIQAIRVHMSSAHPANFLFIGARRTSKPIGNNIVDEIQVIYMANPQTHSAYKLMKCSTPNALNDMNPMELNPNEQRETLKKLNIQNQKMIFSGQIPEIMDLCITSSEIMTYENYEMLIPLNIQCKCETAELVTEVNAVGRSKDIVLECCNIGTISDTISMLTHRCRVHCEQPIVFLQIEQRSQSFVHKFVRCEFQCQLCDAQFVTRTTFVKHFYKTHPDCWIAAKILVNTQIIQSNDPKQPIESKTESLDYFYRSNLTCNQSDCKIIVGTRSQVFRHYNEHHDGIDKINEFEVQLGERITKNNPLEIAPYMHELTESHQMYLFACQHCRNFFESFAKIQQHFADVRRTENVEHNLRFTARKLMRCHEDRSIRTFGGLKIHYDNKHPGKRCTPVSVQPLKCCGLCCFNYDNNVNALNSHYEKKHANGGETYTDAFLTSINLDQIDINQCKYLSGCCSNIEEQNQLHQMVDHTLKCERRFSCTQYPNQTFSNIVSCLLYCMEQDPNTDCSKIINDLQCLKTFLSLISSMQIISPNGFIMTMQEIADTALANGMREKIGEFVQKAWNCEKQELSKLLLVNDGEINSIMNGFKLRFSKMKS